MENINFECFKVNIVDNFAIIKFKNDTFKLLGSRTESDFLLEILDGLKRDTKIKALLFLNEPECFGEKAYDSFLGKIKTPEYERRKFKTPKFFNKKARIKEMIILNRFVKYIANYKKLCFTVLSGDIVTPFFGLALATDIRYATPDTFFSLSHNKHGLHPSGGLPYFLINQLGYNKAIELMFMEKISSQKALELGLINKIVPNEDFLDSVVEDIERIIKFPTNALLTTKRLSTNVYGKTLSKYLIDDFVY